MKQIGAAFFILAAAIIAWHPTRAAPLPPGDAIPPAAIQPADSPTSGSFQASLTVLHALMQREVPGLLRRSASHKRHLLDLAAALLQQVPDHGLDRAQVLLVVDRNPAVQEMLVVGAFPGKPWEVIGAAHVSTGKPGRKEHFLTPTGVFRNTANILGYRAEGTKNENGVRGLGVKGMRVWDFGWQQTDDWRSPGARIEIRMEMHATDPDLLEPRIGRADSKGCIRIPAAMNRFLDRYGLIDAELEVAARTNPRFAALLAADRMPTAIAGTLLIVVDSSVDGRGAPVAQTSKETRGTPSLQASR
jgi:hypothetical protein